MGKLKHTPGPWVEGLQVDCIITKKEISNEDKRMSSLEYYGGHVICESVEQKNRDIIAAAPEMLDSLIEAVHMSRYAAASKMENTEEFIKDLFEIIELFQSNSKTIIEKATGLSIEEVLKDE